MTNYNQVTNGKYIIKFNYDILVNNFLPENANYKTVISNLAKDLRLNKTNIKPYLKNINFIMNKYGILIDYSKSLISILEKYNIYQLPKLEELNHIISITQNIKSKNQLKTKLKGIFKNVYRVYKNNSNNYINSKNSNYFNEFIFNFLNDLKICSKLLNSQKRIILNNISNLCDEEKVYYYVSNELVNKKSNLNKHDILNYLLKYINHIKPYINEDFTLNLENNKISVKTIIKYLESNSTYKFYDNSPKSISNIQIYDFQFFINNSPKLIHEKLKMYCKMAEKNNDENLNKLLIRKLNYYLKLEPISIKEGINKYNGYIGFVIGNKVILEHFFEDLKNFKIAKEEAIYIVFIDDFENVVKLNKIEVINGINNGTIDVKRIYHTGNWEQRANKILKLDQKRI